MGYNHVVKTYLCRGICSAEGAYLSCDGRVSDTNYFEDSIALQFVAATSPSKGHVKTRAFFFFGRVLGVASNVTFRPEDKFATSIVAL